MRSRLRITGLVALMLMPALISLRAGAEPSCPFLNAATAEGILGGAVTARAEGVEEHGSCEFVRKSGARAASLRIEVITLKAPGAEFPSYLARCGRNGIPLRAIGNQAVGCGSPNGAPGIFEQVVGRVRDRAFVIRIETDSDSTQRADWQSKAQKVAEQVAGNLF